MSSVERFSRLAEEVSRREEILKQKSVRDRTEIKESELIKVHLPSIDKVCKDFSKGIGWKYRRDDDERIVGLIQNNKKRATFTIYNYYGRDHHEFNVGMNAENLHVSYYYKYYGGADITNSKYLVEIPFDKFTEGKLAQALEDVYKIVHNL